jgi:putative ABC transport system ATP-binding protein
MKEAIIKCSNVWKIFNEGTPAEVQALKGITLRVDEGEMLGIIGASGSGKSTLLNMVGILDRPTRGSVFISGQDIGKLSDNQLAILRRKNIGFVFQSFNLINSLTALQNVELPMVFKGLDAKQRREKAIKLLTSVGLGNRLDQRPPKLSGGENQRIAIARAMANDPMVILADEPTGNLDSKTGQGIIDIFKTLNKQNRTIIVITHDPRIAKEMKRVVRIADGKIVSDSK